ncbi:hypothetical protein MNBD_GAMMA16-748 [hydrothermal vent metagenome]|uniref:T6SS Phospholipase effector Tle1-like catalytic domain-containing protein n=1 Tax=hydrothermal vent metagenome TaxID=652676 RepID=A0A3B0Z7F7_9ZZZZ
MKKKIIICCDGTWSAPESLDNNSVTNVVKMLRSIQPNDTDNTIPQIVYYNRGLGTGSGSSKVRRLFEAATGYGISRNIEDCYRFLANNYVAGDELYFFGFSRGAYTVRALIGLLDCVGLLDKDELASFPEAFRYYRTPPNKRMTPPFNLESNVKPSIHLLGVWDTVGALGVPIPMLHAISKKLWVGFFDTKLSEKVERGYQALAIDEHRKLFTPALWSQSSENQHITQAWFSGTHSNIGGGRKNRELSDIAFSWIVNRAKDAGLIFSSTYLDSLIKVNPNPSGKIHPSFSMPYKLFQKNERHIRHTGNMETTGEMIHESVIERLESMSDYKPENILQGASNFDNCLSRTNGHLAITIGEKTLPIFRERKTSRTSTTTGNVIQGEFTPSTENKKTITGKIGDYSTRGGASLNGMITIPFSVGTQGVLKTLKLGNRKATVAWCNTHSLGLKFAN